MVVACCCVFFFFQAEDGIRDLTVTGVQTCALPISPESGPGTFWLEVRIREDATLIEVQLGQRGRSEGESRSGAQLEGREPAGVEREPGRRNAGAQRRLRTDDLGAPRGRARHPPGKPQIVPCGE